MKRVAIVAATAILVVVAVHGKSLGELVSGADQARVAGFRAEGSGPGERDVSALFYRFEGILFADRHAAYVVMGLVLLALAAFVIGLLPGRMGRDPEAPPRGLPLGPGLVAAALFAAHPLGSELALHLPGQVTALALALFGGLFLRGLRRPDAISLLLLPLIASVLFRETLGLGFLLLIPALLITRPAAGRSLRAQTAFVGITALALVARIGFEFVYGPALGARDVAGDAEGFFGRFLENLRWLTVPHATGPEGLAPVWIASFAIPLVGFLALGLGGFDAERRRASLASLFVFAGGLLLASLAPTPDAGGGDIRTLALPFAGLASWLALAADAGAKRGPTEIVVLGLLSFFVYSGFNAAGDWRERREAEVFGAEYEAVVADLDRIVAQGADRLVLHGLDDRPRTAWSRTLPARYLAPWGKSKVGLRAWAGDELGAIDAALLPEEGGVIVAEWWPTSMLAAARRPQGWRFVPVFVAPREGPAATPIRLVSPAPDARMSLSRPESIEDDTTFVFETPPDWTLPEDGLFAFYSLSTGGLNPKGRGEIRSRPIVPSTLISEVGAGRDGWTLHRWRPSIRPEDGHDGVRFEDPDLGARGPFVWSIGAVRLAGEGAAGIPEGHSGHLHDRAAIGVTRPFALAQTRRVHFSAGN